MHTDVSAALHEVPPGVIDGGEIVLLAVKPSMWRPVLDSAAWSIACFVCAVVFVWVDRPIPGLSLSATPQLMIFLALVRLGIALANWVPRWHILTNRRIIDLSGVRAMHIDAWPLVQIRNTYLHHSSAEKVTHLGTITFVKTEPATRPRQWRSIANSQTVHAEIRKAIENALDQQHIAL